MVRPLNGGERLSNWSASDRKNCRSLLALPCSFCVGRAFQGAAGNVGNDGRKSSNGLDHVGTTRIDLGGDFLCNFVEALDQDRQVQVIQRFAQKTASVASSRSMAAADQPGQQARERISPSRKRESMVSIGCAMATPGRICRGQHRP